MPTGRGTQQVRVMHVVSGDLWAGAESQTATLVRTLQEYPGVSVKVATMNYGRFAETLEDWGIDKVVLDERRRNGLQLLRRLLQEMQHFDPDIVHTHRRKENVLGSVAAWLSGRRQCIRTVHGSDEYDVGLLHPKRYVARRLDEVCGRHLQTRIVAVSPHLQRSLARFPREKLVCVPNGIDVDRLAHVRREMRVQRLKEGRTKVALVGRMVAVKRVDVFLRVARELLHKEPGGYEFFIFGDGPMEQELADLAKNLDIGTEVRFMGNRKDLPAWLAQMDLLLITSDHEGLPLNLLEAMAIGVPVVARSVGGIPKAVEGGAYATLIEGENIELFAEVVRLFRRCPEVFQRKARAALARVDREYSAPICAARYLSLYLQLMEERRTGCRRG